MSMTHIETYTAGSAVSTITFSSIPQDYTDLMVLISANSSGTTSNNGNYDGFGVQFNNSQTGYSSIELSGNGSNASSNSRTTQTIDGEDYSRFTTGIKNSNGTFGPENYSLYISNYTASQNKSCSIDTVGEQNEAAAISSIAAALWSDTSAITSIKFALLNGDFIAGSTFSLYGITAGSDGTTTVS